MIAQLNKEYIRTRPTKLFSRLVSYFFFEGRPLTTKGSWINPFLFSGYRVISFLPQVKKVESPIFIIGTGRSGSTLLGMLLSMHKQVGFLNEPKALWHFAYNKEDIIGSYSTDEANYKLDETHVAGKTETLMKKLYGFYLTTIFSKRVVDKYPELIFRIEFVKKIFPDVKFIFLQRNGFDTCASTEQWIKTHRVENNNEVEDWWGLNNRKWKLMLEQIVPASKILNPYLEKIKTLNKQTDMAAVEWIAAMEEGIYFQKKYPESIFPVKYEELTANPEIVLSNIFSFCNLDYDSKCIAYAKLVLNSQLKKDHRIIITPFLESGMNILMKDLGY
ncbi:MAG: sulfotransferase [Bacteroidota bacterium]